MAIDLDARRRQLDILVGVWDTTIIPVDDEPCKATDTYAWSGNGLFLQHDVDARMGSERMRSLEIIAVDPSDGHYLTRSYDADGTMNDFRAELDGRHWRLIGQQQRFSGVFSAGGEMLEGDWEQFGNEGWKPLMRVTLRKRA